MIVVVTALLVLFVCVLILARAIDRDRREHARERKLLIDQLLHLSGRTWTPPPSDDWAPPPAKAETVRQPEQMPADLWDGD